MGKQIIDLIGELVSISGNSTVDSIIFAVIGAISFMVAFGIVGWIFDATGRYDSDLMSDTHWLVRVLVFAVLTWVGVKIAQVIKWLFSFQWWVYVIAGVVFVGIIILMYYIKHRISKNKHNKSFRLKNLTLKQQYKQRKKKNRNHRSWKADIIAPVVIQNW